MMVSSLVGVSYALAPPTHSLLQLLVNLYVGEADD